MLGFDHKWAESEPNEGGYAPKSTPTVGAAAVADGIPLFLKKGEKGLKGVEVGGCRTVMFA